MIIDSPEDIGYSTTLEKSLLNIRRGIDSLNNRELTAVDRERILEALMVPQIRKSLNIEGIRASIRQTQDVLDFYRIEGEIREGKDNQAIINLQRANNFICSEEAVKSPLTIDFIKKIHLLVTQDTGIKNPGEFLKFDGVASKPTLLDHLFQMLQNKYKCFLSTPQPSMAKQLQQACH